MGVKSLESNKSALDPTPKHECHVSKNANRVTSLLAYRAYELTQVGICICFSVTNWYLSPNPLKCLTFSSLSSCFHMVLPDSSVFHCCLFSVFKTAQKHRVAPQT